MTLMEARLFGVYSHTFPLGSFPSALPSPREHHGATFLEAELMSSLFFNCAISSCHRVIRVPLFNQDVGL
jgi:hypothetical protein